MNDGHACIGCTLRKQIGRMIIAARASGVDQAEETNSDLLNTKKYKNEGKTNSNFFILFLSC